MTIAVGILASDGIIIAADTEETYGFLKLEKRKVDMAVHWATEGSRSVLLAGAGNSHLIDTFTQHLESGVLRDARLNAGDPTRVLDQALEHFYQKKVLPFQHYGEHRPDFDLVLGYAGDDGVNRLYVSNLNALLPCDSGERFAVVGIGSAEATRILRVLLSGWTPTLIDASILAAYTLFRVKEIVPGCGKNTDIRALHGHGFSSVIPPHIEQLESAIRRYAGIERSVFRATTGSLSSGRVAPLIEELRAAFNDVRKEISLGPPSTRRAQQSPQSPKRGRKRRPPSQE